MGQFILKIKDEKTNRDYYLEWSTVVDAPVSYGFELEAFREYYRGEYGESAMRELPPRLERVEKYGCSVMDSSDTAESLLKSNRAGEKGRRLTKEQILSRYCRKHLGEPSKR